MNEPLPVLFAGTNEIKGAQGMLLSEEPWIKLLSDPVWREYDGKARWVALANVNGMLCLIEVKITKKEVQHYE